MPKANDVETVERVIHAPASAIFDLLANPHQHPQIDGSGTVRDTKPDTLERLTLGSTMGPLVNRYRCKDGAYRWFEWRSVAHADRGLVYASAHFAEGERLAPHQWTIWRGSMRMQGLEPMGGPEFMEKMTAFIDGGGRMNKIIP